MLLGYIRQKNLLQSNLDSHQPHRSGILFKYQFENEFPTRDSGSEFGGHRGRVHIGEVHDYVSGMNMTTGGYSVVLSQYPCPDTVRPTLLHGSKKIKSVRKLTWENRGKLHRQKQLFQRYLQLWTSFQSTPAVLSNFHYNLCKESVHLSVQSLPTIPSLVMF